MTLGAYILQGKARLQSSSVELGDPLSHMKLLAQAVLRCNSSELLLRWDTELDSQTEAELNAFLVRRLKGEPFQYIEQAADFWKHRFAVGPGVLIPRPETEVLVETLLQQHTEQRARVAELGVGSGVIGICCLLERPEWKWFGWELNPDSMPFIQQNRKLLPQGAGFHLEQADFFQAAGRFAPYDWIVSNPPYVPASEIDGLSREVRQEPRLALDGGQNGLEIIHRLISLAPSLLIAGGGILLEIGSDQGDTVRAALEAEGFAGVRIVPDLAGRDRVAFGRLGNRKN